MTFRVLLAFILVTAAFGCGEPPHSRSFDTLFPSTTEKSRIVEAIPEILERSGFQIAEQSQSGDFVVTEWKSVLGTSEEDLCDCLGSPKELDRRVKVVVHVGDGDDVGAKVFVNALYLRTTTRIDRWTYGYEIPGVGYFQPCESTGVLEARLGTLLADSICK